MQKFIIDRLGDQCQENQVVISGQDARHIKKVLRLGKGDTLSMTDGQGRDYAGRIDVVLADRVLVSVEAAAETRTESALKLTICSAMLKDKKMDGIVKDLTQLGVTQWVPYFSSRSVVRPDARNLAHRHERWQSIARESLKQCRRSREVSIPFPVSFEGVLDLVSDADHRIIFWEGEDTLPLALDRTSQAGHVAVLIGPEGGFSQDEVATAEKAGFRPCTLGPRILRAETAALTAAVLVQYLAGDLGP